MTDDTLLLIAVGGLVILGGAGAMEFMSGNLSASQIKTAAAGAGFTGADLNTAVAVALAETGGNPAAIGDQNIPVPGAASYGLWQINSYYHPQYDTTQLLDPTYNASAAYAIYLAAGSSFSPWSTFKGGQYASFLSQAQSA